MEKIIHKEESYKIMGACFNVYREMGSGFLESVYQECLKIELMYQKIPFKSQEGISLFYREKKLNQTYRPDFLCFDKIILEIKAVSKIVDDHRAQIQNYLNASKLKLGVLVNFGHYPKLEYERFVL
jgi:GxxExxY protein